MVGVSCLFFSLFLSFSLVLCFLVLFFFLRFCFFVSSAVSSRLVSLAGISLLLSYFLFARMGVVDRTNQSKKENGETPFFFHVGLPVCSMQCASEKGWAEWGGREGVEKEEEQKNDKK